MDNLEKIARRLYISAPTKIWNKSDQEFYIVPFDYLNEEMKEGILKLAECVQEMIREANNGK